jgi:hypothetical protein
VPVEVTQQIRAQLFVVTLLENGKVNQVSPKEELKILSVAVEIAIELPLLIAHRSRGGMGPKGSQARPCVGNEVPHAA